MSSVSEFRTITETLTERRTRWSALVRKGHFQAVIEEVLEQEKGKYANSKVINFEDQVAILRECALILASAPSVFNAAVDGSLVSRIQTDDQLKQDYESVQQRAHDQPSIYIHLLADGNGDAPTPNQYLQIRKMIMDYIDETHVSEHAYAIDDISKPHVTEEESRSGYRKYLYTNKRSPLRVETLKKLCEGIEQRWQDEPESSRDIALRFPPGECGYSKNAHTRLADHRNHRKSNYIMNLVEDIATYLHRKNEVTQHFRMHQFIIYLMFRPNQAAIAEIFCSGLLQVWVGNGGGFNAHPAGLSVASARNVSAEDWGEHEKWVRETSKLEKKIEEQKEKVDEWREALEWEAVEAGEDMLDATD